MINLTYQAFIIRTFEALKNFESELHQLMINIMLHGELKDWNDETDIGDVYEFNSELISSCNDENLQVLIGLYKKLVQTKQKLKLQNNLE